MRARPGLYRTLLTVAAAALAATLSPSPLTASNADAICREDNPSQPREVRLHAGLSEGRMVVGAPSDAMDTVFDHCHLARWNEPSDGMVRTIVLVFNASGNATFGEAVLSVSAEGVDGTVVAEHISIGPGFMGVYLFVGPPRTISMWGVYDGRLLVFRKRELPAGCKPLELGKLLDAIKEMEPTSTLRSRVPNLNPAALVMLVRIQFDDTIVPAPSAAAATRPVPVQLSEDRLAGAFIECS